MNDWSEINSKTVSLNANGINNNFTNANTNLSGNHTVDMQVFDEHYVVGINANKIPDMQNAIEDYINNVNSKLEGLNTLANSRNAFQGDEVNAAIQAYNNSVKEACFAFTSQLRAFKDLLNDVRAAYMANDASNQNTIQGSANQVQAGFQQYSARS